jgi:hypothetical protein
MKIDLKKFTLVNMGLWYMVWGVSLLVSLLFSKGSIYKISIVFQIIINSWFENFKTNI